jgi:hypothetical protein
MSNRHVEVRKRRLPGHRNSGLVGRMGSRLPAMTSSSCLSQGASWLGESPSLSPLLRSGEITALPSSPPA